jgi:small subunit ribosomal protein S4
MARDASPQCKQCRREGQKLFLKGERCLTDKCGVERRNYPPGEHGRGRMKQSEYRLQLREKQKARRYYGVLEQQFRNYYDNASASPPPGARPASSSVTGTGRSTAAAWTSRATRSGRAT